MMTVTPTLCTVNDLRMRETLARAERYHQFTCADQPALPIQKRPSTVTRLVGALHRPSRVLQPQQAV